MKASAEAASALYLLKSGGDEAAARAAKTATLDKAWAYYQRAHLHAGAIGSVVIGLCLALAHLQARRGLRRLASLLLGFGGPGYSSFWMLAAWRAPGLASTGAAAGRLLDGLPPRGDRAGRCVARPYGRPTGTAAPTGVPRPSA